jgi:hypothetical protein
VVRARSRIAGLAASRPNQVRQIAPQERLPAREANLVDAERGEDVDQTFDLLEVENVFSRQPHVIRLRHAVTAAEVAPVRDRHA